MRCPTTTARETKEIFMTKQELEEKLEQTEKSLADYQFNYPSIKELEQENAALKNEIVNLKGVIESLSEQRDGFENENAELKEQNANLIAMLKSEREVRVNVDYLKGICEKEAEIGKLEGKIQDWTSEYYELENLMNNKLAKAKEILAKLLEEEKNNMYWEMNGSDKSPYYKVKKEAEEFLKECQ